MATNGIRLFNDDGGATSARAWPGDVHNGPRVKDQRLVTGLLSGNDPGRGGYIRLQCHRT